MDEERKTGHRRTVDHGNAFTRWMIDRTYGTSSNPLRMRPNAGYIIDVVPPPATCGSQSSHADLPTKFVHTSINKIKHPVLAVKWTPDGRRLVTASLSGEFTVWNGMSFNFETIMQAHDHAIRALVYSHNDDWLLSGDQEGLVKFWQPNFNNVNILQTHREAVRDIAFSPNDSKFATASDDGTVKIWNFADAVEENTLRGHGWDVKCVDWHPSLGLVVSGSKDNLVKLWDPRMSSIDSSRQQCVATLHGFKNTVSKTKFQNTGGQMLLASASKDSRVKVLDLRTMRDLVTLRHDSEVSALTWHPVHSNVVTSGTHKGVISHYLLDSNPVSSLMDNTSTTSGANNMLAPVPSSLSSSSSSSITANLTIPHAHDWPIWTLDYHRLGHVLCSGSNDKMTRFWCRSRPNDETAFKDRFYSEEEALAYQNNASMYGRKVPGQIPVSAPPPVQYEVPSLPGIPGLSKA